MSEFKDFPQKNTCQWNVISYIVRNGANSRTEIAKILNVTGATLTKVTSALIKEGLLCESGVVDGRQVGRRQVMVDVVADYRFALGIDVANTYLRVTLLDLKLQVREQHIWNFEYLTQMMLETGIDYAISLTERYGKEKILGVGLLAQGCVEDEQCLSLPLRDVKEQVMSRIDLPVILTNNIRGLAIAHSFLEEAGKDFLLVNYGPGICSVIMQNGDIYRGSHNKAGEIGHALWNPKFQKKCRVCGKYGCLESMIHFDTVAQQAAPEYVGINTDYETLMTASNRDGGESLTHALELLARVVNLTLAVIDPQSLILSGQIFTNPKIYQCFLKLLQEQNCDLSEHQICLLNNYQEKRLKSAGIVVFDAFFEGNFLR